MAAPAAVLDAPRSRHRERRPVGPSAAPSVVGSGRRVDRAPRRPGLRRLHADPAQPEVPVPQHDGQRRRHRRAHLVAGLPAATTCCRWRVTGWTPDWYAGFPAGQFYFPVPTLLIVLMNVVMPYNVAFKIGTALGSLLLPIAAYVLGRRLRARVPRPRRWPSPRPRSCSGPATPASPRRASRSRSTSTSWAGRSPARWPVSSPSRSRSRSRCSSSGPSPIRSTRRRRLWLPALLLALTVTSHLIVGVFAVVAGLIVWLFHHPWRNFGRTVAIGVVGALLTAVWALPLLATYAFTTDMRYSPIGESATGTTCNLDGQHYVDYLFPSNLFDPHGWQPYRWGAVHPHRDPHRRRGRAGAARGVGPAHDRARVGPDGSGSGRRRYEGLEPARAPVPVHLDLPAHGRRRRRARDRLRLARARDRGARDPIRTDVASGVASDVPPDARWDVPVATYACGTDTATIPSSDGLVFDEEAYLDLAYPDSPRGGTRRLAMAPVGDVPVGDVPVGDGLPVAGVRAGRRRADPVPERLSDPAATPPAGPPATAPANRSQPPASSAP